MNRPEISPYSPAAPSPPSPCASRRSTARERTASCAARTARYSSVAARAAFCSLRTFLSDSAAASGAAAAARSVRSRSMSVRSASRSAGGAVRASESRSAVSAAVWRAASAESAARRGSGGSGGSERREGRLMAPRTRTSHEEKGRSVLCRGENSAPAAARGYEASCLVARRKSVAASATTPLTLAWLERSRDGTTTGRLPASCASRTTPSTWSLHAGLERNSPWLAPGKTEWLREALE
eukprot:scaffold15288_cov58-Phaeocystis_antarctica.AAC.3